MESKFIGNVVRVIKSGNYTDDEIGKKIALAAKITGKTLNQVYEIMKHGFDYVPEVGARDIYNSALYHYNHMGGGRTHRRTHRGARKTHRRTHRKSGKSHRRGRKTRRH